MKIDEVAVLENKYRMKLLDLNETETAEYLNKLLLICLEDLENENLYLYNQHLDDLNKAVNIVKYRIKNFESFYNSIKLNAANCYLKKLLNHDEMNILNNTIEDADLRDFRVMENSYKFKLFEKAIAELSYNSFKTFSNNNYTVYTDLDDVHIIDKNSTDVLNSIKFVANEGYLEVLESLVTGKDIKDISESPISEYDNKIVYNKMLTFHRDEKIFSRDGEDYDFLKDELLYYNESADFVAIIKDEYMLIFNKTVDKGVKLYFEYGGSEYLSNCITFIINCFNERV